MYLYRSSSIRSLLSLVCCVCVLVSCSSLETGDLDREHRAGTAADSGRRGSVWGLSSEYSREVALAEQDGRLQGDVEPEPDKTKAQELKDLKLLGRWEQGVPAVEYSDREVQNDFPVTLNRQVEYYLDFFSGKHRKSFSLWLSRSGKYLPMIKDHLRAAGR